MEEIIKYQTLMNQDIELSPSIVRKYLVNGQGNVTDQEITMFIKLCEYQHLNPFLREAYLIKYGNSPATIVTGKETFLKRAVKNPRYKGHETSISDDGKKAYAKVYVENYSVPVSIEVDFNEYVGKKADGTINRTWSEKPHTMLKKVALVQALREAFPEDFGGMYSQEEINTITEDLPIDEIKIDPNKTEPPNVHRNYTAEAEKCKTLDELKAWYLSLTKEEQKKYAALKNNVKEKIEKNNTTEQATPAKDILLIMIEGLTVENYENNHKTIESLMDDKPSENRKFYTEKYFEKVNVLKVQCDYEPVPF